jgi:uncharacterized paraquat-inducible protein A
MRQMKCQQCGFVIQVLDDLHSGSLSCPSCGEAFTDSSTAEVGRPKSAPTQRPETAARADEAPVPKPSWETPSSPSFVGEQSSLGCCRHCGYSPVAPDAFICPKCGGRAPNPGVIDTLKFLWMIVGFCIVGTIILIVLCGLVNSH